ncbi:hypothetical protein MRX96_004025 [Rhipicephalus microplus]
MRNSSVRNTWLFTWRKRGGPHHDVTGGRDTRRFPGGQRAVVATALDAHGCPGHGMMAAGGHPTWSLRAPATTGYILLILLPWYVQM